MSAARKDIDWLQAFVGFGATTVALSLMPWALHFGRDGGRWWLTAVALIGVAASELALIVAVFGLLRLRKGRNLRGPGR